MMLTFASLILFLVISLSVIFIALYFHFTRNFKFWQKLGISYVNPTPFVGNLKECAFQKVNLGTNLQHIYEENSDKPYVGIFSFDKPVLLIRDLELVKNILVKDSHKFMDRIINFDEELDPMMNKVLFALKGQRWRHMRAKLTPVYTSGKMKKMFYLVDTCGRELADCLDKTSVYGSPVDVVETMYRYTTDVIASCAFGIDGYSLKDPQSEFRMYSRNIFDYSVVKGLAALIGFTAPAIQKLLRIKFLDDDTTNYLRKTVWTTVEYREKNGVVRNDFLDCMMELRKKGKEDSQEFNFSVKNPKNDATLQIDGDDFVGQAFQILAAGFETSGSTMTYAVYELALHPEIQNRLRAEIMQVMNKHNGQVTYDSIQEMTYLDMVVSETLRKYPILPFLDRVCSSDYKLPLPSGNGTVTLPAGTAVMISVLGIQHDTHYYPEPKKFDPDRFTEENKHSRPKYTHIPFGEGIRICLGMRFAQMQMKIGLCHILSKFEVAPCKDTPVPVRFEPRNFLHTVAGELPLTFIRLQQ